jgi:predicted ATPase/class 3 adenylate cyclase
MSQSSTGGVQRGDDGPTTWAFMFTDLVGSTLLWEHHPEQMTQALARHDEICADIVARSGGDLFKHTGDGIVVAFPDAGAAARAAVALHVAFGAEPWPSDTPIRARIGIHVGSAEHRGNDYFGAEVSRAARIMGAAHGGQVLVSAAASPEIAAAGFSLVDLGTHRFKGLIEPVRVFHLAADELAPVESLPGLATTTAKLRQLSPRPTIVPERQPLLDRITAALAPGTVVTLVGPSGIGKSRLALAAAHDVAADQPDGVVFVDLGRGEVDAQCVQALGLSLSASDHAGLVAALEDRHMVLVLDHADRSMDPVRTLVADLAQSCPNVTVLVTSTRPLGFAGERVHPLGPLTTDARAVFVEAAPPDAPIDDLALVDELCRELDGNPLAIELAAARTTSVTVRFLLDNIGHSLESTAPAPSRAERHQSLATALDWTLQMLSEPQSTVIDAASTFASWFDLDDIVATTPLDPIVLGDVIGELVALSLLRSDEQDGRLRFRLGNSLRRYRRETLRAAGRLDALFDVHADHVSARVAAIAPGLRGRDERAARTGIEHIRAELGHAVDRLVDTGRFGDATTLVTSLSPFESICWPDLAQLARTIVDRQQATGVEPGSSVLLAQAASAWMAQGDFAASEVLARRATELDADAHGELAWSMLANTLATSGRLDEARTAIQRGVDVALEGGRPFDIALSCSGQAIFAFWSGDVELASAAGERALQNAEISGSETALVSATGALGTAIIRLDPDRASDFLSMSAELAADVGNVAHELIARRGLGVLARTRRDYRSAFRHLLDAMELAESTGSELEYRLAAGLLVNAASRCGEHDIALLVERSMGPSQPATSDQVTTVAAAAARRELGADAVRIAFTAGRLTRRELLAWLSGELEERSFAAA